MLIPFYPMRSVVLTWWISLILEFGNITFLLVSLLMAIANYRIRINTKSFQYLTLMSIIGLSVGSILILYYEFAHNWEQIIAIIFLYIILAIGAWLYSRKNGK